MAGAELTVFKLLVTQKTKYVQLNVEILCRKFWIMVGEMIKFLKVEKFYCKLFPNSAEIVLGLQGFLTGRDLNGDKACRM